MGILEYLLGPNDKDPVDVQPPPSRVEPVPTGTSAEPRLRLKRTCARFRANTILNATASIQRSSRSVVNSRPLTIGPA
jgi:hypothetical protein